MTHNEIVIDSDAFFEIDPITRSIKNMTPSKISVMQNDHNSERFTFSIPRYVEGHDMMTSDKVEVHFINIDSSKQNQTTGIYEMPDLQIDSGDTEKVTCSWLLSHNATKYAGKLTFLVRFVCFVGDTTEVDYAWNTAVFDGISVGAGLDVADETIDEYVDIIEAWKKELEAQIHVWVDDSVASQGDLQQIQTNKENIETLTEDQNELKTRVDNLLTAETVDGELIDVRVGYDGKTYTTAGEATREQIKDIHQNHKEDIERIAISESDIDELQGTMIVSTAEGESIHLKDSAKARFRGLKLFGKTNQKRSSGKNKIPEGYSLSSEGTTNGVSYKVNDDGTITLNGTATGAITLIVIDTSKPFSLEAGKEYCLSGSPSDASASKYYISIQTTSWKGTVNSILTPTPFTALENPYYMYITIGNGVTLNNVVFKPQIEEGSTATEYEPPSGGIATPTPDSPSDMNNICADGSVEVGVYGKNLIPYPYFDTTLIQNGITFTDNGDGTITVNGTAADTANFMCANMGSPVPIKAGTYLVSGCPANGGANTFEFAFGWRENVGDTRQLLYEQGSGIEYTFEKDGYIDFICVARKGVTANNDVFKPMMRVAESTDGTWEAYKEPQTIQVTTENGLMGIPVTSGGNYTDVDGQQWVCDEIDLARGVYVQRINKYTLTGEESWGVSGVQSGIKEGFTRYDCAFVAPLTSSNDSLWSHFPHKGTYVKDGYGAWVHPGSSTKVALRIVTDHATAEELKAWLADKATSEEPVTVLYILAEPIETPLTDEEIEVCKALHTNRLVTTIFNDEGAWMSADYVADTKTYIDNKFLELEKTILNTTT